MIRAICAALICAATTAGAQERTDIAQGAVLRALDKLTGQATDIEIPSGTFAEYGRLSIFLRECRFPTGNRAGNAYAGLDIREEGQNKPVFQGWMIASAPALSAMDHAHYDIWVIRCTTS